MASILFYSTTTGVETVAEAAEREAREAWETARERAAVVEAEILAEFGDVEFGVKVYETDAKYRGRRSAAEVAWLLCSPNVEDVEWWPLAG